MKTSALEPLRYLSQEEMNGIHQAALQILERTGMWIDHVQGVGVSSRRPAAASTWIAGS